MKSATSTKVYWKARKLIQSIVFRCKSLLYKYIDKAEIIKESSSIRHIIARQALKEGIRGVIWALIALIIDRVFQQILNISADNRRVFVSVIICTIGVAGVILGLYCSSITSIYSTRYANAPEKIALAFQRDWLTRRSISSIISYIISGMAIIIEVLLGCAVGWASVALLASRLVYLLVAYGIAGNRSYQLSDVYHVADDSYRILFRIIRKRLKQNVFSADASFQNHFLREAEKKIDLLKAIQKYGSENQSGDNTTMVEFMCRNLILLEKYWENKETIGRSSLWFRNEAKYQRWHLSEGHEASVALNTGTTLRTKTEQNYWWFEEEIVSINHSCLKVLFETKDYFSVYKYLQMVEKTSKTALYHKEAEYYLRQLDWLGKLIEENAIQETDGMDERRIFGGIVDIISLLYMGIILDSRKYYEELKISEHMNTIVNILDSEYPVDQSSLLQGSRNAALFDKIATEISVEGYRITPDWLIKQYIAKEEYDYLNSLLDIIRNAIDHVFTLGKTFSEKELQVEACIVLTRFYEYESKLNSFIEIAQAREKELRSFQIDKGIKWNEFGIMRLQKSYEIWKMNMPDLLLKCSSHFTFKYWENIEDYPDFIGECFNHICEDAIEAIVNNDTKQFKQDFESLSKLMILYQEYIRTDFLKKKDLYRAEYVFYMCTSPIVEWAQIGGLAIVWGEFHSNNEWKDIVEHGANSIFIKDEKTNELAEKIVKYIQNREKYMIGSISGRDLLETGWNIRVENAIRESGNCEVEYELYGYRLKTDSKLLKAFCNNIVDSGFLSDPSEVFWVIIVNPLLSKDKQFHTQFSWEEKLV